MLTIVLKTMVAVDLTTYKSSSTKGASSSSKRGDCAVNVSRFTRRNSLSGYHRKFLRKLGRRKVRRNGGLAMRIGGTTTSRKATGRVDSKFISSGISLMYTVTAPDTRTTCGSTVGSSVPIMCATIASPITTGLTGRSKAPTKGMAKADSRLPVGTRLRVVHRVLPSTGGVKVLCAADRTGSMSTLTGCGRLTKSCKFAVISGKVTRATSVSLTASRLLARISYLAGLASGAMITSLTAVLSGTGGRGVPIFKDRVRRIGVKYLTTRKLSCMTLKGRANGVTTRVLGNRGGTSSVGFRAVARPNFCMGRGITRGLKIAIPRSLTSRTMRDFARVVG